MKNRIKYIISYFTQDRASEKSRSLFESWITSSDDASEKNQTLNELWESVEPLAANDTMGDLQRLLSKTKQRRSLWHYSRQLVAAAVIGIMFFGGGYLTSRHRYDKGDEVILLTSKDSKGRFVLPDSTIVWLNKGSRLSYNTKYFGEKRRNVSLSGEGYFEVKHSPTRPFIVDANQVDVEVLGTVFDVRAYECDNVTEVILMEGSVKLSGEQINDMVLNPNERFTYDKANAATSVNMVKAKYYAMWRNNNLRFTNSKLQNIVEKLQVWYNRDFEVAEDVDQSVRMTFTIGTESIDETMSVISILNNIDYKITDNKIIITKR